MTTTPTLWGRPSTMNGSGVASAASIAAFADGRFAVVWETLGEETSRLVGQMLGRYGTATGTDFLAGAFGSHIAATQPEALQLDDGRLGVPYINEFEGFQTVASVVLSGGAVPAVSSFIGGWAAARRLFEAEAMPGGFAALTADDPGLGAQLHLWSYDVGNPSFRSVIVDTGDSGDARFGDVAVLADGGYAVTWHVIGRGSVMWMHLFNADLTPRTDRGVIQVLPFNVVPDPQIAALADGGYAVAWFEPGYVYSQKFTGEGAPTGPRRAIVSGSGADVKVTALRDGGWLVGWSELSPATPNGSLIAVQRYAADGRALGAPLMIDDPGTQRLADMETLSDGRVALAFFSDATGSRELVTQIIDPRAAVIVGTGGADSLLGRLDADSRIEGLGGNDSIDGMGFDDSLFGGWGADALFGGGGADMLIGGAGADFLGGGDDDDALDGGSGQDNLNGGAGDDRLVGAGGNDSMLGADGDDVLNGGDGQDTLDGGRGDDTLNGAGGVDSMVGGDGDDVVSGGSGNDFGFGQTGDDTLRGGSGNDYLGGGAGEDAIDGGAGNDTLVGGAGRDRLTGGDGADLFWFIAVSDSGAGAWRRDVVTDFTPGDLIGLSAIDANGSLAGDPAFMFIGAATFTAVGQVRATVAGGVTIVEANTVGAAGAEFAIALWDAPTLTAADFLL